MLSIRDRQQHRFLKREREGNDNALETSYISVSSNMYAFNLQTVVRGSKKKSKTKSIRELMQTTASDDTVITSIRVVEHIFEVLIRVRRSVDSLSQYRNTDASF